jgi:ribonuclease Z
MPTPNLICAGENATLLIHEATMADDQAEMAARKAHSTFGQAVGVGTRLVIRALASRYSSDTSVDPTV